MAEKNERKLASNTELLPTEQTMQDQELALLENLGHNRQYACFKVVDIVDINKPNGMGGESRVGYEITLSDMPIKGMDKVRITEHQASLLNRQPQNTRNYYIEITDNLRREQIAGTIDYRKFEKTIKVTV